MKINDFIKAGGVIEDLYFDNINTVTRIPINPWIDDSANTIKSIRISNPRLLIPLLNIWNW